MTNKFLKIRIIVALVFFSLFFWQDKAQAAILYFFPHEQTVSQSEHFLVEIRLDSENEFINAVEAEISYSTDLLEVVDLSQGGSFLELWVTEPTIDQQKGIISFVGGIPRGSLVVDGRVMAITFRAKPKTGTAQLKINEEKSGVYLNDGLGTPAPLSTLLGTYSVNIPSPYAITINSSTHPQEDKWYQDSNAIINWETKSGAFYSYQLSQDPQVELDNRVEEITGEVTYEDLPDGIYYFSLREKLEGDDWGDTSTRRLMIDTSPPLAFAAKIGQSATEYNGKYFLTFATRDLASGIEQYQVIEGEVVYANAASPYILVDQSRKNPVVVRAIDKAGNITESTLPAIPQAKTNWTLAIIGGFGVIIIVSGIIILKGKKH